MPYRASPVAAENFPVFYRSDAWLLFSIAMGSGRSGASLRDIIANGDYLNHAILSGPQIRRGIAKLLHAGFIREEAGRFLLAGKAKSFWKALLQSRKSVLRLWDEWDTFLAVIPSPPSDPRLEQTERPFPAVSDAMVKQAYDEYVADFYPAGHPLTEKPIPARKKTGR